MIKYLYDSYSHLAPLLLGFLLDVLEKGPSSIQPALLTALNCSFNYVDLTTVNTVSTDLLRAISKHLDVSIKICRGFHVGFRFLVVFSIVKQVKLKAVFVSGSSNI